MELTQLQQIYSRYLDECAGAAAKAGPLDGFFGMGQDPRKDPCHMRFYEAVEQWTAAFRAGEPGQEQVFAAVRWMLCCPAEHRQEEAFWFLFAAQGFARELIPELSAGQCRQLRELYEGLYPRRDRMPVQQQVYRLLCRGAGRK